MNYGIANVEYETDNFSLICIPDQKFLLLDLNNNTFKSLPFMWHTTMVDCLEFVCENADKEFIREYAEYCISQKLYSEEEELEYLKGMVANNE